jgi:prolyl-tRNA synthetase
MAFHSALGQLAIQPIATLNHNRANSPQAWREILLGNPASPNSFQLIKTLVYKPKTAKSAAPVPVVVVARDETETSSSAIGKALNLKELRLGSEDLLTEFFSLDKNSCA